MSNKNKISELKSKIFEHIKETGPVLPAEISKHMQGNLIFASAILSELVGNKMLKMSHAKIGGSRLYYCPGQEDKLVRIHDHLSEKPRKVFDILKEHKVLRDSYCEPLERVALRELIDFAVPLTVTSDGHEEIFWKWFTVSDEEAKGMIGVALEKDKPEEEIPKVEEAPVQEVLEVAEVKKEPQKKSRKKIVKGTQEILQPAPLLHSEDDFTGSVLNFFKDSSIFIIDQKLLSRDKEINFVIEFSSVIGKNCYYAKAKNKKKISDKDITEAFEEAQKESLPLLFISNGELTKKAQGFIAENMRGIVFKQV